LTYYEGMFLLDPADAARNWDDLKGHVLDLISKHGGEVLYTERWQDRKLAYEIKGRRKGTYLLTYFQAEGEAVADIRRDAQLSDRILRVLILRNDRALAEIEERKAAQAAQAKEKVAAGVSETVSAPPIGEEEEEIGLEEADRVTVDDLEEVEEEGEEQEAYFGKPEEEAEPEEGEEEEVKESGSDSAGESSENQEEPTGEDTQQAREGEDKTD